MYTNRLEISNIEVVVFNRTYPLTEMINVRYRNNHRDFKVNNIKNKIREFNEK